MKLEDVFERPWRVGFKLGRTVYAMVGDTPSPEDGLLGMMETQHLAAHVVALHNESLRSGE